MSGLLGDPPCGARRMDAERHYDDQLGAEHHRADAVRAGAIFSSVLPLALS